MSKFPLFLPNLPKKTKDVNFNDAFHASQNAVEVESLLSLLTSSRKKAVDVLLNYPPKAAEEDAVTVTREYVSLVIGLTYTSEVPKPEEPPKEEKKEKDKGKGKDKDKEKEEVNIPIDKAVAFSWSNFARKERENSVGGIEFDINSLLLNLGLYTLLLAKETLSHGKDDVEKRQKEAYKIYARASGVFQFVAGRGKDEKGDQSDLRPNVSKGLSDLALAEGESIAVDRAEKANHTHSLIAAMCNGTSQKYQKAKDSLLSPNPTPNPSVDPKLIAYLDCRINFYLAKAYYYQGLNYANPEATKAGLAVKAFDLALNYLENCNVAYGKFSDSLPGPERSEALELLTETRKVLHERYLKAKSENDVVYYDQIPDKVDDLPEPKTSLETAQFDFPDTRSDKWNEKVYAGIKPKADALENSKKEGSSAACCLIL